MDYSRRNNHVRIWLYLVLCVLLALIVIINLVPSPFYAINVKDAETIKPLVTTNTTRLYGTDVFETAAAITQAVYPATFKDNKPGAVILTPKTNWQTAMAAIGLIHHPIDAPVLFIEENHIPATTLNEIERLDPEGNFLDGNVKVYVVGNVTQTVLDTLQNKKLKYRHFMEEDYNELAYSIDEYKATLEANHQDEIVLLPTGQPEYALLAGPWVAHMGHSIFFVESDAIPQATIKALEKRPVDAYLYLFGPPEVISKEIAKQLTQYGHVQRIPGDNPNAFSTGFAGYKDVGRNQGYWFWQSSRSFGWGVSEAGHNVTIVNPSQWQHAISASVLSHKGKHGPMLWVDKSSISPEVKKYLKLIQPFYLSNQEQLFNFGWIIGGPDIISRDVQLETSDLLRLKMN